MDIKEKRRQYYLNNRDIILQLNKKYYYDNRKETYSLTADIDPGSVEMMSVCRAAGLRVHPSGVGHVLPWESIPIFTRRRGSSKKGGGDAAGFPSPRSSAHLPLAGCVGSGHWAHAWWNSLYPLFPRTFR